MININKKVLLYFLVSILLFDLAFALQSTSNDYISNNYFGSGGSTDAGIYYNTSHGYGQIVIGNFSDIDYQMQIGIFYIGNQTANVSGPSCSISNLNLCVNQTSCESVGAYWYNGACHQYQQTGGGGGTGGGTTGPNYVITPKVFSEILNKNTENVRTFFIKNLEVSTPLTIEIVDDEFSIYTKRFSVQPQEEKGVEFIINTVNKSGTNDGTIILKILKSINNYEVDSVFVNYTIKSSTYIEIENQINKTKKTTFIDLINSSLNPETEENLPADLTATEKAFRNITNSPLFYIILFSLLAIAITITIQMSKGDATPDSPNWLKWTAISVTGIIFIGIIFFWKKFIAFINMIPEFSKTPEFYIILTSVLILIVILVMQLSRDSDSTKKWSWRKTLFFALFLGLFILAYFNWRTILNFMSNIPEMAKTPQFYVVTVSLLVILIVSIFQLKKKAKIEE